MNREIKFRGKRTDNGEWVYGYYALLGGNSFIYTGKKELYKPSPTHCFMYEDFSCHKVIPETVGQFTGLHDADGKEIYEDDIIECIDSKGDPIRHQILYSDKRGCLCKYGTKYEAWNDGYIDCGAITQSYLIEHDKYVIGNIHDNPDLLTTK
ncbi:MAG: YopX family protein [Dysgonamonadaceae bacterium]|jgi:uncharacterized phage protein (TIGR01671 family)|nr:YopX family protein [Dysgonamonadaceae bacterium]